jgi:hypothetical protein
MLGYEWISPGTVTLRMMTITGIYTSIEGHGLETAKILRRNPTSHLQAITSH